MANEQNLVKIKSGDLSKEELKKRQHNGGVKSGEVRRERRTMREQMEMLLKLPLQDKKFKEEIKSIGITDNEIDNQMAMMISVYRKALKGDMKAVEIYRDTLGEKPVERIQEIEPPKIVDDI